MDAFVHEFSIAEVCFTIHGEFFRENVPQNRICVAHSFASWKHPAVEKVVEAALDETLNIPVHQYQRNELDLPRINGWIKCRMCSSFLCSLCTRAICRELKKSDAFGIEEFNNNIWCLAVDTFNQVSFHHRNIQKFMEIPGELSHCCSLKIWNRQINKEVHRLISNGVGTDYPIIKLDGLLHYCPYRALFAPSSRFYECLAVAEQGLSGDTMHQEAVQHSVIPHQLAYRYEIEGIIPTGIKSDVIEKDEIVTLNCDMSIVGFSFPPTMKVRHVILKRDSSYRRDPPKGSCPLDDTRYFQLCTILMDESWEDDDLKNGVDIVIISGRPGRKDKGKSTILLCFKIYLENLTIPSYTDKQLNKFLQQALNNIPKHGHEVRRRGGSGGLPLPDNDWMHYHRTYRSSLPVIAAAAVHIPKATGNWVAAYISPYVEDISAAAKTFEYSPPRSGGALSYKTYMSFVVPLFFERMAVTRFICAEILQNIRDVHGIIISPKAVFNQLRCNQSARFGAGPASKVDVNSLICQVVYSFVGYTVGVHKDVSKQGVPPEFIECKALLRYPRRCKLESPALALGRGGMGRGIYTFMIVDHPKKSTS